jgi:predicted dehydrogenase
MKILVIGLGGIGQRHVRNLRALLGSSVEILAYRTRRLYRVVTPALQADPGRDVEEEYGIKSFASLEAALAEQPNIAFICNPSSLHVPAALACLCAGCDVFLEKPVSHTFDGVLELLAAAEKHRSVVMVGYQLRFHPCVRAVAEILERHLLGRILAVRAVVGEYLPGWHPYEDYREMYASRSDLGGGVILSQIHEFDYLYALFGLPRRIFALGGHWSRLEIDVEDIASILMECEVDGRLLPIHLQQDYVQRPPARACEIVGDRGKVVMDLSARSVLRYDEQGNVAESQQWNDFDRNQLFLDELRHFLQCVETRAKPLVDLADGICSLRMALTAKQSVATRSAVELLPVNEYASCAS